VETLIVDKKVVFLLIDRKSNMPNGNIVQGRQAYDRVKQTYSLSYLI